MNKSLNENFKWTSCQFLLSEKQDDVQSASYVTTQAKTDDCTKMSQPIVISHE